MRPTSEQIQARLAALRAERPREEYWNDFIPDFHRLQREQNQPASGLPGLRVRLERWLGEARSSLWIYGAGLLYAGLTVILLRMPARGNRETMPQVPANYQHVPAPPQASPPQE